MTPYRVSLTAIAWGLLMLAGCGGPSGSEPLDLSLDVENGAEVFLNEDWASTMLSRFPGEWKPAVNPVLARGSERIYEQIAPGVVVVRTKFGFGTGFVIDSRGHVLTNQHVVEFGLYHDTDRQASQAQVFWGQLSSDGRMVVDLGPLMADVLDLDDRPDLALLRLPRMPAAVRPIALADAEARPGQDCVITGHPHSTTLWTVRECQVTGRGRYPSDIAEQVVKLLGEPPILRVLKIQALRRMTLRDILVSDCVTASGDSGGPIVDRQGRAIGVTFGGPADSESFSFHTSLGEVRAFLQRANTTPTLFAPAHLAYRLGPRVKLPASDVLVAGEGPEWQHILLDLDQNTPQDLIAAKNFEQLVGQRRFDREFVLYRVSDRTFYAYYDRNNDGKLDLILLDDDGDDRADTRFTLGADGRWTVEEGVTAPLLDSAVFGDPRLGQRMSALFPRLPGLLRSAQG